MKISHIEHLGIAVQSIEESLPFFTGFRSGSTKATRVFTMWLSALRTV